MSQPPVAYAATWAERVSASEVGIGIGVREISVFSSSAGYCTAGVTMPRMKFTSATRSPQTSASRRPANAANSSPARYRSPMVSCSAQTCSVLATYARG